MRHPARLAAGLVLAALAAAPAARAAAPGGGFVMLAGRDTIAVESFGRTAGGMQGLLVFRLANTRVVWTTVDAPGGGVARIEALMGSATDPPGSPPRQSLAVDFAGDSAFTEARPGGTRAFATVPGALPFLNPSVALMAEFALRTMPIPGGRAEGSLFMLSGGGTEPAIVTRPAVDSVVVAFAGVTFCFGLDGDGDIVRGRVPEQGLEIVRVAELPRGLLELSAPDYSPPAGAPYTAEEVAVPTREGHTLAGTLTRPAGEAPVPCVVTITGSGAQDRDGTITMVQGYRPFRGVADALARRGVATLRLDDRGVGGSDAPARGATTETFVRDVEDALAWLRARPGIDGARLALAGHSEGGIIAPLVAARDPKLRAIALLAAPAWTGRRVIESQNRHVIDRDTAATAGARDSTLRWAMEQVDSLSRRDAWLAFFLGHDPLASIRQVRVPVLLLQGATDRQVTAGQADELAAALARAGNRRVTTRVFPGLNHLFLEDEDGDPAGYRELAGEGFAPPVRDALADWLAGRLK